MHRTESLTAVERAKRDHPERFKYKVYFKSHGASIVLLDGLTYFAAKQRCKVLYQMYTGWKGHFVVSV